MTGRHRGNPRRTNGTLRNKRVATLRQRREPCWICVLFGRDGTIDYSLPAGHPLCFECDELTPVSLGGDPYDPMNLAASHRICNQKRGNRTVEQMKELARAAREGPQASQASVAGKTSLAL